MNSLTKLMGLQMKIPKIFEEKEDMFMEQLIKQLTSPNPSKLLHFYLDGDILDLYYHDVFTGAWEFVDMPIGW